MKSFRGPSRILLTLAILAAVFCFGAFGQSTQMQPVDKFSHEVTLPIGQIGFSGTPDIPAGVLESIQGGALEIRQSVEYVRASNMLRIRHFLVAPKSPNPTPGTVQSQVVDEYLVYVTDIKQYSDPMSVVFMGKVDRVLSGSPFGALTGLPVIYAVGYTMDSDTGTGTGTGTGSTETKMVKFNNVALLIPGKLATYAQTSTGTLTFGTGTNPGGGTEGPVANAGMDMTTAELEITLDASKSTMPEGETLTYKWRVVQGSANLLDPNSMKTRVQFAQNYATYIFEVTVTDTKGRTNTAQVKVTYSGRF